ncbi:hypothetical protein Pyn_35015 [Prunus yedoensis var. nudiflora]|uniref:Uncharacterized protein n=1 Tax=Prunus yedoensis var. nudiflora TaxID=2094558 RepID=A0A314US97_PRUYE|nr:hypothetical protein Pyn_35015 [Prunus yedoensis var. nudiflora]
MSVARLAYVRRRVDENGPFGLRPETCPVWPMSGEVSMSTFGDVSMSVARLAYVKKRVDECGPFGLHQETCR